MTKAHKLLLGVFPLLVFLLLGVAFVQLLIPLPEISLFSQEVLHAVQLTLKFSLLALFASFLLAHIFNYFFNTKLHSFFRLLWVMPGFAYAIMVLYLFKGMGVLDRYSMNAVWLAWVIAGVPYLSLSFRDAKEDLDLREREALQSLGASPLQLWFHFDFLRTKAAQIHALSQQFFLYLTSFSLVMILSGGPPNETLEVSIYTSLRLDQVNMGRALSFAIWQSFFLISIRVFIPQFKPRIGLEWNKVTPASKGSFKIILALLIMMSLIYFRAQDLLLDGFWMSALTSLCIAIGVVLTSLLLSLICYFCGLRKFAEIGAWISPMVLTLAWWKLYVFHLPSYLNCILIQSILFSPWVARSLFPLFDRARNFELEAAQSLGAHPIRAWFLVEWHRVKPGIKKISSVIFFLSITEVASVLLFSQGDFQPLSAWIQDSFFRFRLMEGLFGTLVLIIVSYGVMERGAQSS